MLAAGRGDEFAALDLPQLAGCSVVVVWPGVSISTADAFRDVVPAAPAVPLAEVLTQPLSEWRKRLVNDFGAALAPRFPVLGKVKQALYAAYAALSGSGSAVFGVFEENSPTNLTDLPTNFHEFGFVTFVGKLA